MSIIATVRSGFKVNGSKLLKILITSALSFQTWRSCCWQNQTAHPDLPWGCVYDDVILLKHTFGACKVCCLVLIRAPHCVFYRHLHQQHIGDDVQKGQLWNRLHRLSSCYKSRSCSFSSSLLTLFLPMLDMTSSPSCSTILGLGMLSGTAVSLALWIICWGWWAAGPSSAVFGTCHLWTERWSSLAQPYREIFCIISKSAIELSDHLGFFSPHLFLACCFLLPLYRKGRMQCSLPTEWKQP